MIQFFEFCIFFIVRLSLLVAIDCTHNTRHTFQNFALLGLQLPTTELVTSMLVVSLLFCCLDFVISSHLNCLFESNRLFTSYGRLFIPTHQLRKYCCIFNICKIYSQKKLHCTLPDCFFLYFFVLFSGLSLHLALTFVAR